LKVHGAAPDSVVRRHGLVADIVGLYVHKRIDQALVVSLSLWQASRSQGFAKQRLWKASRSEAETSVKMPGILIYMFILEFEPHCVLFRQRSARRSGMRRAVSTTEECYTRR
jgi:hypothetical protein